VTNVATRRTVSTRGITPLMVGILSLVLTAAFVGRNVAAADGDPSIFLAVGEDEGLTRSYVESLLGDDIALRSGKGHDGKYYFALANDPLLLDPDRHAFMLDRPTYRAQRMLFPLIAGLGGSLPPWLIVWGMLALSVVAIAVGTYGTALVAQGMGGSALWGLAFGLNLGIVSELTVGGAGHLGAALLMLSIAALQRRLPGWSVAFLTGAVLTREVLLVSALGMGIWLWHRSERLGAVRQVLIPGTIALTWAIYVRLRVGGMIGVSEVEEIGLPFSGLLGAARLWPTSPLNMVAGLVMVAILCLLAVRVARRRWLVGYAAVGFVPLAALLTRQVWFSYFDISRALAPVITAYLLVAFAADHRMHDWQPVGSERVD
jgi:hypothetical protein